MKTVFLLSLILLLIFVGCSSKFLINPDNNKDKLFLSRISTENNAVVTLMNRSKINVKNIDINPDTTKWLNLETKNIDCYKTSKIFSISFTKRWKGVFEGFGLGFLSGAVTGMTIGLASGNDPPGWFALTASEKALYLGLALGTVGGVLGIPIGALVGSKSIYYIEK